MHSRPPNSSGPRWRICFATILCIALVFACGMIQAVHSHPDGNVSHADCGLCTTAHVAVQVSTLPVFISVTPVIAVVEEPKEVVASRTISTFALFTRPPPPGSVLA